MRADIDVGCLMSHPLGPLWVKGEGIAFSSNDDLLEIPAPTPPGMPPVAEGRLELEE